MFPASARIPVPPDGPTLLGSSGNDPTLRSRRASASARLEFAETGPFQGFASSLDKGFGECEGRLKPAAEIFGQNAPMLGVWRFTRGLPACLAAALVSLLAACGTPHRYDCFPAPMSTRALVPLGLRDDPEAWACVDAAHDAYLKDWSTIIASEASAIADRLHELTDPFSGVDRNAWSRDLPTVQGLARRHATILNRMESLDTGLISAWTDCLGSEWSGRLEALRIDRSIERWRNVAEAGGPAILDLRLMIPALELDEAARRQLMQAMGEYARRLEPLARALAEARLRAPIDAIRLRESQMARDGKIDENAVNAEVQRRMRKPHDAILQLDFETIDQLRGAMPEPSLDRLREAIVDASDRGRPRYAEELLAPVAAELLGIDERTRAEVRRAIDAHETADAFLRAKIAEVAMRDPEDPKLADLRKQRAETLKSLNAKVIELLPESMRGAMKRMRSDSVSQLRGEMDRILDPAVASRLQRALPEPEPALPVQRLPVRNGNDVLAQLMPPDFAAWAEIRLPALAEGDADRSEPIRMLVRDASERWKAEHAASLERLQPLQKEIEAALRDPVTLNEMQRRLRLAVAELDAARSRLQLIEDPVLLDAASIVGLPMSDPRIERLRLERATEFAGLGWRDMPVQTLFQLDREATIDLPTVIEELDIGAGGRAIADMALVDNAVPLIETAESLRQACVAALRGLVIEIKRAQLRGAKDAELGPVVAKAVRAGAAAISAAAEMRLQLQRSLLTEVCDALPKAEARALRRAYWRTAFPELFVERKPVEATIDRLVMPLPPGGEARAAAEALLEAREEAIDRILPELVEARRKWLTDANKLDRGTFAQLEREAPTLGLTLRLREEIDARALRSLASLHGDDPAAWQAVAEWGRERPVAYEAFAPR